MITLPLSHKDSGVTKVILPRTAAKCARERKPAALIGDQARTTTLPRFAKKTRRHRSNLLAGSSLTRGAERARVGAAPALPKRIRIAASAEPARARRGRERSGCRRTHR